MTDVEWARPSGIDAACDPAARADFASESIADVQQEIGSCSPRSESDVVYATSLRDEYAEYVWAAERLATLPGAVSAVERGLES